MNEPKEIPVSNDGDTNLHIAGVVIRPGTTRMIDARQVPEHLKPNAADAITGEADLTPPDPLLAILDGNVASITAALPDLSDEDLEAVELAEQNGKTRKGVLEALAHERLRRAAS